LALYLRVFNLGLGSGSSSEGATHPLKPDCRDVKQFSSILHNLILAAIEINFVLTYLCGYNCEII